MCQKCILSPQLFNTYGELIIRYALEHWTGGISIEGRIISHPQYADDTIWIVSDKEEMAKIVNLVKIASERLGLHMNASKTKVIRLWIEPSVFQFLQL